MIWILSIFLILSLQQVTAYKCDWALGCDQTTWVQCQDGGPKQAFFVLSSTTSAKCWLTTNYSPTRNATYTEVYLMAWTSAAPSWATIVTPSGYAHFNNTGSSCVPPVIPSGCVLMS